MTERNDLHELFIRLLLELEFDKRYYGFVETHRGSYKSTFRPTIAQIKSALSTTSLEFKHMKRESFFDHTERHGDTRIGIYLSFAYSMLEVILFASSHQGEAGGPCQVLITEVGALRDPDFKPSPPAPQLPFSSIEELTAAVELATTLFKEVKQKLLAHQGLAGRVAP